MVLDEQGAPVPDAIIFVANSEVDRAAGLRVMDQKNKQFLPSTLLIQQGQTVRFPNSDNIRHHVYSFSQAKSFELALYGDSRAPDVNFNKPGAVAIACNIHDQMKGFIFVSPGSQAWQSNQQGEAMIPDTLTQASVWHPRLSVNGTESVAVSIKPGSHIVVALKPEIKPAPRTFGNRAFGTTILTGNRPDAEF